MFLFWLLRFPGGLQLAGCSLTHSAVLTAPMKNFSIVEVETAQF